MDEGPAIQVSMVGGRAPKINPLLVHKGTACLLVKSHSQGGGNQGLVSREGAGDWQAQKERTLIKGASNQNELIHRRESQSNNMLRHTSQRISQRYDLQRLHEGSEFKQITELKSKDHSQQEGEFQLSNLQEQLHHNERSEGQFGENNFSFFYPVNPAANNLYSHANNAKISNSNLFFTFKHKLREETESPKRLTSGQLSQFQIHVKERDDEKKVSSMLSSQIKLGLKLGESNQIQAQKHQSDQEQELKSNPISMKDMKFQTFKNTMNSGEDEGNIRGSLMNQNKFNNWIKFEELEILEENEIEQSNHHDYREQNKMKTQNLFIKNNKKLEKPKRKSLLTDKQFESFIILRSDQSSLYPNDTTIDQQSPHAKSLLNFAPCKQDDYDSSINVGGERREQTEPGLEEIKDACSKPLNKNLFFKIVKSQHGASHSVSPPNQRKSKRYHNTSQFMITVLSGEECVNQIQKFDDLSSPDNQQEANSFIGRSLNYSQISEPGLMAEVSSQQKRRRPSKKSSRNRNVILQKEDQLLAQRKQIKKKTSFISEQMAVKNRRETIQYSNTNHKDLPQFNKARNQFSEDEHHISKQNDDQKHRSKSNMGHVSAAQLSSTLFESQKSIELKTQIQVTRGIVYDQLCENLKELEAKTSGTLSYNEMFLLNIKLATRYYKEIEESLTLVEYLIRKQPLPYFQKISSKRQTIVFDLDETLIKAINDPSRFASPGTFDVKTELRIDRKIRKDVYVSFRPYLFEMLRKLKKRFELIVFTAGFCTYADVIIKEIQREEKFFDHVISRDFCSTHPSGKHQVKDLIQLLDNRSIKDIVIVDNKAISFAIHFTNGIPIRDYEGDKSDTDLIHLTKYLLSFQNFEDVRVKIKEDFKLRGLVEQRQIIRSYFQEMLEFKTGFACYSQPPILNRTSANLHAKSNPKLSPYLGPTKLGRSGLPGGPSQLSSSTAKRSTSHYKNQQPNGLNRNSFNFR